MTFRLIEEVLGSIIVDMEYLCPNTGSEDEVHCVVTGLLTFTMSQVYFEYYVMCTRPPPVHIHECKSHLNIRINDMHTVVPQSTHCV